MLRTCRPAQHREPVREALALMELLAGLLAALWGGGEVAQTLALQVTAPGCRVDCPNRSIS